MDVSYGDSDLIQLKKYLLTLPQTFNFKYIPEVKKSITETLNSVIRFSPNDLVIDESNHNHYGRACGKKFLRGETCYRCLTCGYDETCALCSYCFQKERHLNHQIHKSLIQRENAGCCDCGDEEAYKNSKCEYFIKPSTSIIDTDLSDELIMHLTKVLAILIDYIIDVMNHSVACFKAPDTVESVEKYSRVSNLDPSIYGEIDIESDSFALVLYSDQVHQYKDAVQRIRFLTGKVTEFAEMVASRCNIHGRAVVMISNNISFLLKKQEMLTSTGLTACIKSTRDIFREEMCDEIISWLLDFTQSNISKNVCSVRCTIAKVLLRPYQKGCINNPVNVTRENVMLAPKSLRYTPFQKESIPDLLSRKWDIPEEIKKECEYPDILLESQNSQDIQFIGSRLQFLLFFDVRFCKTPRIKLHNIYVPTIVNNLEFKQMMVAQFLDIYEEVLSLFLLIDREPEFSIMPILSTQVFTCPSNDSLILKHGDVFKMIRAIYNYVTTCQTVNTINSSFPGNKTGIVFSTLKNRKWAHVLLDLTYIVTRNPYVDNIISFFYCFPEYVHFLAVFQSKPAFQREAKKHIEYENQDYTVFFNAVSVISHFSENIGKVLNRVPKEKLLSQGNSMDCWYHSYSNTMKKSFTETLYTIIVRKIIEITFTENDTYFNDMNKTNSKFVEDQEDAVALVACDEYPEYNMVKFNVLEDKMSFLHPLHSMFSWLVEMDQSMDSEKRLYNIMDIIQGEYEFHCSELISATSGSIHDNSGRYDGIMGFFDIPVRKIVLVSQIKVGLWVRNGVSIRSQMNLYRYSGSREFGYMRDLFLCQLYLGYLPVPQLALYNVFDRWRLAKWSEGEFDSNDYNPAQLQAMVEEFVLFVIHLVTEDLHLHKKSATELSDLLIQREIVHALCFKPLPFSKITAEIPDHICTEKRFSVVFSQCVEEVEKSNRNKGERKIYKLKESLMDTVDPYYVHYNSNKRDECITIMKERIHQITGIKKSEVVIPLKNINWRDSPFERITNIVLDERLINFLLFTLLYCKAEISKEGSFTVQPKIVSSAESRSSKELNEKGNCESLLELTIHLIHITVTHKNASEISSIFLSRFFSHLLDMLKLAGFSGFLSKIKAILKIVYEILKSSNHNFSTHFPEFNDEILDISFESKNITVKNKWENDPAYEKKKKMAKRKRNKLLAKLKKQQQKFAENFCIDEDSNTLSSGKVNNGDMADPIEGMEDVKLEDRCRGDDVNTWSYPEHTCILCHLPPANDDEPFGVFSYITESNEFRYVPCNDDYWFFKAFNGDVNLDEWESSEPKNNLDLKLRETEKQCVIGPGFSNTDSEQGGSGYNDNLAVVTSCCHGMHHSCFKQYFDSSRMKQMAQITRTVPENTQRREFFCPLCKTINNVFVPIYFTKNSQNFFHKFSEEIPIVDLIYPKTDQRIIRDQSALNTLSNNLFHDVKSKVRNKDWFIKTEIVNSVIKHTVDETSITRNILMECMDSLSLLTPPFESINSLISKTIESIEISLRGEGYDEHHKTKLLIFQINNQTLTGLRIWIQLKELFQCLYGVEQSGVLRIYPENLIGIYENLFNEDELLYDGQDFFEILVSLEEAACLGINFQKLVGISYVKHVQQSLLKILNILMHKIADKNLESMRDFESLVTEEYRGDKLKMREIAEAFTGLKIMENNEINLVYSMLLKLVTPFLRKCLIFAYAKFASFPIEKIKVDVELNECDRICQVMKLPTTEEIINGFDVETFRNISDENKNQLYDSRIAYPGIIRLISLPQKLNDFYTEYYNKKKEEERPKDPAICLYCSKMVDLQTANYGDEFGSCNMHTRWECIDAGKGIFLLPRNNCILLLDNGKGSFIESPYMDDYGEGDEDAKKGHDMHLSESKYKELQMSIWLQHNIQNFIARKLENLSDVGGWLTL